MRPQKIGICKLTRVHGFCVQSKYTGRPGRRRDRGRRWHGHHSQSPLGNSGSGERTYVEKREGPTGGSGKPNAEPNTMARRTAQPSARRTNHGSVKKGFDTRGPQTAPTGFVTTVLGMYRKAMTRMKNHAQIVCTILMDARRADVSNRQDYRSGATHHRSRVAGRTVAEIHHPRMRRARPHKIKGRILR